MNQYDIAVEKLIDSIIRAAKQIDDKPEKVEKYIREKIAIIYHVGQEIGKSALIEEVFEGK